MSASGQTRVRRFAPIGAGGRPSRAHAAHRASYALALAHPELSARRVATRRQIAALLAFVLVAVVGAVCWPAATAEIFIAGTSVGFVASLMLRTCLAAIGRTGQPLVHRSTDEDLPVYTVLVPLFHEAEMLPRLSRAMQALDYPPEKLDLKYVVEEDDLATRQAAEALALAQVVVVPSCAPRTKPKACNYALQFARGSFLVIYDAEDRPDPDQLRKAVAMFAALPDVDCVQARLVIDIESSNWLVQMFALDYALWFRTLLPGLARVKAPIPLGGTSNHFRTEALIQVGAWDPFNVTEDADLGYRLARLGRRVSMLDSNTREEAPARFDAWLRQRTRWMKGYTQTILVHMRNPSVLLRSLGLRGFIVMQAFLGGAVWSSLVNPLLWLVFVLGSAGAHARPGTLETLSQLSGLALLAANALLAALSLLDEAGRLRPKPLLIVASYPLYWLLISLATYRAMWQLLRDPFRWEKTPHGGGRI